MCEGAHLARAPELLCCRTAVRISLSTLRICTMSPGVGPTELALGHMQHQDCKTSTRWLGARRSQPRTAQSTAGLKPKPKRIKRVDQTAVPCA